MIEHVTLHALMVVLVGSLVPLGATSVIAFVFAVLQTVTQIQEQTFMFLVRIVTVVGIAFCFRSWGYAEYQGLVREVFEAITIVGRG